MRSFISALVLAASFTLLVPDNGAQAVNAAEAFAAGAGHSQPAPTAGRAMFQRTDETEAPVDSDAAILLALGFLAAVMARRLRAD
jgi:hypothetical protein